MRILTLNNISFNCYKFSILKLYLSNTKKNCKLLLKIYQLNPIFHSILACFTNLTCIWRFLASSTRSNFALISAILLILKWRYLFYAIIPQQLTKLSDSFPVTILAVKNCSVSCHFSVLIVRCHMSFQTNVDPIYVYWIRINRQTDKQSICKEASFLPEKRVEMKLSWSFIRF